MTADPRDIVSEFTEIPDSPDGEAIKAFLQAVGWGALASSGLFLILTVPIGVIHFITEADPSGLLVAFFPLGLALAGTFVGMLAIGLPATLVLQRLQREDAETYCHIGVVGGLILPGLFEFLLARDVSVPIVAFTLFLSVFGMIGGGVCGQKWGLFREQKAAQAATLPENPFHDMMH